MNIQRKTDLSCITIQGNVTMKTYFLDLENILKNSYFLWLCSTMYYWRIGRFKQSSEAYAKYSIVYKAQAKYSKDYEAYAKNPNI